MSGESVTPWLSDDQVFCLNEKHGWFQHGDSQSDVSRAFAQDAITMHEAIRSAAPDLLKALQTIVDKYDSAPDGDLGIGLTNGDFFAARAAIAKARGEKA